MTRRGTFSPRRLMARTLGVERFEERRLLSTIGFASDPPRGELMVATPPIAPLVPQVSMVVPAPPRAADGVGEILPVDGGIAFGLAGGPTITASPSARLDNLTLPLVVNANAVGPGSKVAMATGSSDALDLAIEAVFSMPGTGLTMPRTVMVNDSGRSPSGALAGPGASDTGVRVDANLATKADIEMISGPNTLQVPIFPDVSLGDTPSPTVAAATALAGSGGMSVTAETAGGPFLANNPSGVSVAFSSFGGSQLSPSLAALLTTGIGGQASITFSGVGGGSVSPVDGVAKMTPGTGAPLFISFSGSDAKVPASLPAPAVSTSGSFLLAPLYTETVDGYLRIAASGASAPGATAISANAGILAEIGTVALGRFGPSKAIGNAGRVLAMDSTLALSGSRFAAMVTDRDAHDWQNKDVAHTMEPDPHSIRDAAGPYGLSDLAPQRLGLMLNFRPFSQRAVEQTIDQFLEQIQSVGAGLSSFQVPMDIAAELLALAVALTAWNVAPKLLRRFPGESVSEDYEDATSLDGISGLPGGTIPEEL